MKQDNSRPSSSLPLLTLDYTPRTALRQLSLDMSRNAQSGRITPISLFLLTLATTCAAFSAIMYWIDGNGPGIRYNRYFDGHFPVWLPQLGGAGANFAFNTVSFLTVLPQICCISGCKNNNPSTDKSTYTIPSWSIAIIAGFFTTLPQWYIGINTNALTNILTTVSALFNFIINIDGAKTLVDWVTHSYVSGKYDCKKTPLYHEKNELVNTLTLKQIAFEKNNGTLTIPSEALPQTDTRYSTDSQANDLFFDWLQRLPLHQSAQRNCRNKCITVPLFFALGSAGAWINYGLTVTGYRACDLLTSKFIGSNTTALVLNLFGALCNVIANTGFLVKGLSTLYHLLSHCHDKRPTIEQTLYPNLNLILFAVIALFCAFSGFTCDEATYGSILYLFPNTSNATLIGLSAYGNVGCAFSFNYPQAFLLSSNLLKFLAYRNPEPNQKRALAHRDETTRLITYIDNLALSDYEKIKNQPNIKKLTEKPIPEQSPRLSV